MLQKIILLLLIFPSVLHSQTAIMAYQTKDSIVLASDSKRRKRQNIYRDGNLLIRTSYDTVCKIHVFKNNVVFAMAGRALNEFIDLAKQACEEEKSIDGIAKKFVTNATPIIRREMTNEKRDDPQTYMEKKIGDPLELFILKFEDGVSKMKLVVWRIRDDSNNQMEISDSIISSPVDSLQNTGYHVTNMIGHRHNAIKILVKEGDSVYANGIKNGLVRLIKEEIINSPAAVGEPIDVIVLYKTGVIWVDKQQKCESN